MKNRKLFVLFILSVSFRISDGSTSDCTRHGSSSDSDSSNFTRHRRRRSSIDRQFEAIVQRANASAKKQVGHEAPPEVFDKARAGFVEEYTAEYCREVMRCDASRKTCTVGGGDDCKEEG